MAHGLESVTGTKRFAVDPARSRFAFSAKAFGLRWVTGTLPTREGVVELAGGYLSASGWADASSVSTGLRARDWDLRHPHYLDSGRWPAVRLEIPPTPLDAASTRGHLTVRGVTVDLPLDRISLAINVDGSLRAQLSGQFDRSALPMLPPVAGVSRVVRVELDVVAHG